MLKLQQHQFEISGWVGYFFLNLGFTECKAEQPLTGMELQKD